MSLYLDYVIIHLFFHDLLVSYCGKWICREFYVSTIILPNGSGNSQWDVQPFLHLQVKPGAPLYELGQSERKYQLNLRMN